MKIRRNRSCHLLSQKRQFNLLLIDLSIYIILYHTVCYLIIKLHNILFYAILYDYIPFYTILFYAILFYTIIYHSILFYTMLYYSILYSMKLYCILFYSTVRLLLKAELYILIKPIPNIFCNLECFISHLSAALQHMI